MSSGMEDKGLEYIDDLTGLHNRRYFRERLLAEKRKADGEGSSFGLAMIDLDNFKPINDLYGHLTGDLVLTQVGQILSESLRPSDVLCRYAGDEFVLILPDIEENDLVRVAQRIKENFGHASWKDEKGEPIQSVTCSLGYSFYTESGKDLDGLVGWADQALYAVKRRGGNGYCGEKDLPEEPIGRPLLSTPYIVGREKELKYLNSILESAHREKGGLVLIHGEAGVGKTRLVRELRQILERRGGVALLGDCHEETRSIPYYPFREAFNRFFDEKRDAGLTLLSQLPEYSQRELARILPRLKDMKPTELERASDSFRLFEAVRLLLQEIGKQSANTLLLVFEDLHWSDEASLDLLYYLVRNLKIAGILLCGTYRTEEKEREPGLIRFAGSLRREGLSNEMPLEPLSAESVSTMIRLLCPGTKASRDYRDFLYQKTEGNPFFVEEILKYLSAEEIDGCPQEIHEVPLSIYAVLQRRMDSLASGMRDVFACGALIGEDFEFEILWRVQDRPKEEILDAVEAGVKAHVIRENLEGEEGRYRFVHSLMADILYSGIGKVRRKLWHRLAGEALEEVYADRLPQLNGRLVHHFERAEEWEKAFGYALESAAQAKEVYANQEAIQLFGRAKRILHRLKRESRRDAIMIAGQLGETYETVAEYEKALEEYRLVRSLAKEEGDANKEADGLLMISGVYVTMAKLDEAMANAERCRDIYRETGDQKGLAASLDTIGTIHSRRGEYVEGLKYLEMSLETRTKIGDKRGLAKSIDNIGTLYWRRGEYAASLKRLRKALELRREIGDRKGVSESLNMIGNVHWSHGDYDEALKCHEEVLSIRRKMGLKRGVAGSLTNIGNVYWGKGDYKKALRCHEESLKISREISNRPGVAACLTNIGNILLARGEYNEALKHHRESLEISREIGDRMNVAMSLVNIGDTGIQIGEYGHALTSYRESLKINREIGDKDGTAFDLWGIGNAFQELYQIKEALKYHAESLALFDEMGMKTERTGVLASVGVDYHLSGEEERALEYLSRAREMLAQFGTAEAGPDVLSALAEYWLDRGDFGKTRRYCDELGLIAEREDMKKYLVICKRIEGELLIRQVAAGRLPREKLKEAEDLLVEARLIGDNIGALPQLWRVCISLGELYSAKGDGESAREVFEVTKGIITDLASRIDDEKLKHSFLNSEQVQIVLSRS